MSSLQKPNRDSTVEKQLGWQMDFPTDKQLGWLGSQMATLRERYWEMLMENQLGWSDWQMATSRERC